MMNTREMVDRDWDWQGKSDYQAIRTAAMVDISRTLRRLEQHLLSLGADGLHSLIQNAATAARRREKTRGSRKRK